MADDEEGGGRINLRDQMKAQIQQGGAGGAGQGSASAPKKLPAGSKVPMIRPAEDVYKFMGSVMMDNYTDELFITPDNKDGGFPFVDLVTLAGNPNTGKSYYATKVAALAALKEKKRALVIAAEPSGFKASPDYHRCKDKFDSATPVDLDEMVALILSPQMERDVGNKYAAVIVDSLSEHLEDSEYMPEDKRNMAQPLLERAINVRKVKETIRRWQVESYEGKRPRFVFIIIAHLKRSVRPDAIRQEDAVLPIYNANGNIVSTYTLQGVVPDPIYYLSSYVLVFVDKTAQEMKAAEIGSKTPTIIDLVPHKTRGGSRYNRKHFRITSEGVVR